MDPCPVCGNLDNENFVARYTEFSCEVKCARCGEFKVSADTIDKLCEQESEVNNHRYILSYWIKQKQNDDIIYIDMEKYNNIIKQTTLPNPKEISDNLIKLIGEKQNNKHAEEISLNTENISSDIGAINYIEVNWIASYLEKKEYIHYSQQSKSTCLINLELEGWDKYEEISRRGTKQKSAFLAMPYKKPELDKIYDEHFKIAVEQTGFELKRLDEKPSHGLIDERIRFQIQEYRFLVAELTYNNHNVIWEAGYAEGLRKPVMYLCQRGEAFDNAKKIFDINHQTIILYNPSEEKDLENAKEELKAMIRNAIPEAKRTDD